MVTVVGEINAIADKDSTSPEITSRECIATGFAVVTYKDNNCKNQDFLGKGARIDTQVSINVFDYEAAAKIDANGKIVMNLANSPSAGGRKLVVNADTDFDNNEELTDKL